MKQKFLSILAALLLIVAGVQTTWAQGFRVYKSDGTVAQYSLRTDSIVFYDGIGSDEDFGPFTPVNQYITGRWYKAKNTIDFREDGSTDYDFLPGATYKFFPYLGSIIIYNDTGAPYEILKVHEVTADRIVVNKLGGKEKFFMLTTTPQPQPVEEIVLSETSITLEIDKRKTLTATVLPEDADNKEVVWESSDEEVAEVNRSGRVTANANGTCFIVCRATDGSGVYAECKVTVGDGGGSGVDPDPGDHEYVDLGLPSGTLWATCNIGASKPEDYGDYFAWGETTSKDSYTWANYKWMTAGEADWSYINKYTVADGQTDACWYSGETFIGDNVRELLPADDAATANWGNAWQMPSQTQYEELFNSSNTSAEWTTVSGVFGCKVTGKNGKSIFLPAAGAWNNKGRSYLGTLCALWSHSLSVDGSESAYAFLFASGSTESGDVERYTGLSVRPVRKK